MQRGTGGGVSGREQRQPKDRGRMDEGRGRGGVGCVVVGSRYSEGTGRVACVFVVGIVPPMSSPVLMSLRLQFRCDGLANCVDTLQTRGIRGLFLTFREFRNGTWCGVIANQREGHIMVFTEH